MSNITVPTELLGSYTELFVATHACPAAAWTDWDISASVPAGAVAVDVLVRINTIDDRVGLRTNGSAISRLTPSATYPVGTMIVFTVKLDSTRIIEQYNTTNGGNSFNIIGYWS